ncbi:hypothetical protein M2161_003389 [Streptomyces sp. SAI-133]|uniref:hypothetical protein n=1 Tax=unclassified Streptomyces TaxID=2593676 RepID=UPI0024732304|nr:MULTISPECIES: hypothetical protein [unclassified Streptomyces]MDH6551660.1 hypothetical protein [Streptomyces sp. SAI-041]MDH6584283.1 hypothetical protein [Streptomyces sp. SAI-133]
MTACAIEPAAANEENGRNGETGGTGGTGGNGDDEETSRTEYAITGDGDGDEPGVTHARTDFAITVDGSYAARLARDGDCWYPERWTLDGPEPYAVPLPGNQPEEPGTEVQPMADGRVLIRRFADGRHTFSLLYPTGPRTGELPLGAVECPEPGTVLRLLPPAPDGGKAYALAVGPRSSAVWLVAGGAFGPEHLAQVPGRCSGGVWLDRAGRMLALDRETGGRTKAVVVDLGRGGEVSPLLQIADDSDDRLLLADPDSGLLLISSDAPSPGRARLGWGVLGSTLPVRFPECLRVPDCSVTPFAIQPGQVLVPESCGVALRVDGPTGSWVGVWRPAARQVQHLPAPEGWQAGAGLWTEDGELLLPYATAQTPCGVARWAAGAGDGARTGEAEDPRGTGDTGTGEAGDTGAGGAGPEGPEGAGGTVARTPEPDPPEPVVARPVPLQQAPLGNLVTK